MALAAETKKVITLAQSDALEVLWAQTVETHSRAFTSKELAEVSQGARQELGENAPLEAFLKRRSEKISRLFPKKRPKVPLLEASMRSRRNYRILFLVLLFLFGALCEKLTNTGAQINLLSPPILALVAWNLAVYASIVLAPFVRRKKAPWVPELFTRLLEHKVLAKCASEVNLEFFKKAFIQLRAAFAWTGAALFHAGAAALALGIMAGIGFEGLVTNFSVGWESTWLFNKPEWVADFLRFFYGSVPFGGHLIAQINPESVLSMRFGPHYQTVCAAPWMVQLLLILLLWIVLPRTLLAFYAQYRVKRAAEKISLDFEQGFYRKLYQQWQGQRMSILIFPFATGVSESDKEVLKVLAEKDELPTKLDFFATFNEDNPLPQLPHGAQNEVWMVFSLGATPESDVQGTFISDVLTACRKAQCGVRIVVCSTAFEERFSDLPQRIATRKGTWRTFLSSYRVPFAIAGTRAVDFSKW